MRVAIDFLEKIWAVVLIRLRTIVLGNNLNIFKLTYFNKMLVLKCNAKFVIINLV